MIRVLERNGSGGAVTPRSQAHKEQAYGQGQCTPGAVAVRKLLPASSLRRRDRRWAADSDGALSGADRGSGSGIHHPRVLAPQGGYVLPLPQKRRSFVPGGDKAGVVQGDQDALAGLGLRGCGQRFLRSFMIPLIGLCSAPSVGS